MDNRNVVNLSGLIVASDLMTKVECNTCSGLRKGNKHNSRPQTILSQHQKQELEPGRQMHKTRNLWKHCRDIKEGPPNRSRPQESTDKNAVKWLEAVQVAVQKDDSNIRFNKVITTRQTCIFLVGVICLTWPSLLALDVLVLSVPARHVEALQYNAQEYSFLGSTSRTCLWILRLAESARIANIATHGVFTLGCCGFLVGLPYFVRRTSKRRAVMTRAQRLKLNLLHQTLRRTARAARTKLALTS